MPNSPLDNSPADADLCGLPQRSGSTARDRLEEIASDYIDRLRSGQRVNLEDYVKQYPALASELLSFLPLVGAMEDWKVQREFSSVHHSLPEQFELTHLGEFQILREIARGGMGVVFEAEQPSLNRRVAVKLLPWQFPKKSAWAEQFVREARTAAKLQHAQIVPVYSFGEHDNRFYYVMQLIEGVGLDKLIERWTRDRGVLSVEDLIREVHPHKKGSASPTASKRMLRHDSWQQLAKIGTQIVSALRYAHKQGTLHRDIKPGNLLFDLQGKVWITDFGLAMGQEAALSSETSSLSGTLRYMAPEQLKRTGDIRSDIYAFGSTFYELCTLKPAKVSKTRQDLIKEITRGTVKPPRAINPEIPVYLEKIILKCMQLDPEDRYQNADQLYADLLRYLNGDKPEGEGGWWTKIFKKPPKPQS